MTLDEHAAPLTQIWVKDMVGVHRDCLVKWGVDFGRMEIDVHVGPIVPSVLISFLQVLPQYDERFIKTGIIGAVRICNCFNVTVWVAYGDAEVRFHLTACQPDVVIGQYGGPEIQLTAIPE
jgi:hypothetical protein